MLPLRVDDAERAPATTVLERQGCIPMRRLYPVVIYFHPAAVRRLAEIDMEGVATSMAVNQEGILLGSLDRRGSLRRGNGPMNLDCGHIAHLYIYLLLNSRSRRSSWRGGWLCAVWQSARPPRQPPAAPLPAVLWLPASLHRSQAPPPQSPVPKPLSGRFSRCRCHGIGWRHPELPGLELALRPTPPIWSLGHRCGHSLRS